MKTNKIIFSLFLFFTGLTISANDYEIDSLKVYLTKAINKPMAIDITFENISSDSITLRSCFRVYEDMMGTASGFMAHVYSDGQLIGLPSGDEKVVLRYNNCWTIIPPNSKVFFQIPFGGYFRDLSKHKTIGVEFSISYIFFYKNIGFSKTVTTNSVELWNRKEEGDSISTIE
jgi:hypothetical protein